MNPLRVVLIASLASLALSGTSGMVLATVVGLFLLFAGPRLPARAWVGAHGVVLVGVLVLAVAGESNTAFAGLVSWLLVHRRWTGHTPGDVRVSLLLATLLLLLGATGTENVLMGPIFLVYALFLPIALLRAELVGVDGAPRRLELGIAVGTAAVAATLFAVLPRLDAGYLARDAAARFPTEVTLGEEDLLNDDAAEVLRARITLPDGQPASGPFHFRGRAHDFFDGARWTTRAGLDRPRLATLGDWDTRAEVVLEAQSGELLFGVPDVLRVEGTSGERRPGGVFQTRMPGRRITYRVYGREVPLESVEEGRPENWLQIPDRIDPRVRSLAYTIAPDEPDPARVARALSEWLAANYTYVESPPLPAGDPVGWFLFEQKAGHCEYFASALVMLLRHRGIPSRLATGFHSGERDGDSIVVRRGNAHAWVEVQTAAGWATLDPTPAGALPSVDLSGWRRRIDLLSSAWYRDVVEYDMEAQFAAFGAVGRQVWFGGAAGKNPIRVGFIGMFVVLGVLAAALTALRITLNRLGSPRGPADTLARLAAAARRAVRARGWPLPDELPLLEAAGWLEERIGEQAAPLRRLAEIVYSARYGGATANLQDARACVSALRRIPRPAGRVEPPR